MISLRKQSEHGGFGPLRRKLKTLGMENDAELDAVLSRIKVRAVGSRTEDIIGPGKLPRYSTVLMAGVACLYERLTNGNRQIYAFQYPGDFCDLYRQVLPDTNKDAAVAAITDCSIGIIDHADLEQLISKYPSLGRALWGATVLEASMIRKSLLNVARQPALQRVAHLFCEQLARQEAVGLENPVIALSQIDIADAAGLSIVHVSRTFKELQRLGLLLKQGRSMKVTSRERLAGLAGFDGNYLNMPQLLSRWQINFEGPSTCPGRPVTLSRPCHPEVQLHSKAATPRALNGAEQRQSPPALR